MIKLGLFTDAHAANMELTCRTRRPSLSIKKIREAMAAFQEAGCDAVLCLGDLVDDCKDATLNRRWLLEIAEIIRDTGIPFYLIPGNHDCINFTKEELFSLGGFLPMQLSINLNGVTLAFLDGCFHGDGSEYVPGHVHWADALVGGDQVARLSALLAHPEVKRVYLFMHQCLDPMVEGRHIVKNAEEIRRILAASGKVEAVYQGHYHKGNENLIDGIPYHTLPAMVEGEENRFWILTIEDR